MAADLPNHEVMNTPPANTVADYISAIMPERVCCGMMRQALQATIIVASTDGWLYIYAHGGCMFIAICPWCGKPITPEESKGESDG